MGFLLFFLFICLFGGWRIGKSIGCFIFPDKEDKIFFIDKSVHHHHHHHEHRNISIIDDETKKRILELKDSKDLNK